VWSGLAVDVAVVPSPAPNCPTITSDVGTVFVARPGVVNERLFVRLICKSCPAGTVMTTGDQVDTPPVVDTDAGFNAAHVAVEAPVAKGVQK
jgi:hypothetical protein